ncbi:hypothetical protein RY831_14785 [Noviherbaspirillum sp. CPCC 100848]|uniref:Uncharacterized protein n=1 Tax=Noviherbaspirillum album TaxID=3080276 RepID=A0ABU6JAF4_9BURK|nr:hypothetical protein [Noviherbaspirillum sp. CPCC 100848]MEC4720426.1 hypothetical protein [Noviherbaspirillum sp. CPCC 100848]
MLLDILAAGPMERPALAASFGGFVRNSQCHIRIVLANPMMANLGIKPTQHVTSLIMNLTFGRAAGMHTPAWYFADPDVMQA